MKSAASAHALKLPFPPHMLAPVLVSVKTPGCHSVPSFL